MSNDLPNIVLIVMDTARADVFAQDDGEIAPNLAEIASNGTTYTQAFSAAPWTLPSHASIFTGLYPSKHGAHAGHKSLSNDPILLPEVFEAAGYETVAVSNNTWISEEFGFGRGFETFRKNWQFIQSGVDLGKEARMIEGTRDKLKAVLSRLFQGNPIVNTINTIYGQFVRKRAIDDGAKATNDWIQGWLDRRTTAKPFFCFINYLEPHLEYRPPTEYAESFLPSNVTHEEAMSVNQDAWRYIAGKVEMTDRDFEILCALYRAEIAYLDEQIGDLRRTLENADAWEDTIFMIVGDHGENIGDHGLMDHQYSLHDSLIHVPVFVHGGEFNAGGTVDDLLQLTDLAPTLLDVLDLDAPEFREQVQGQSFHPCADTSPREYVISEYMAPQPSMEALEARVGDLPNEVYEYDRSLRAIRTEAWKLVRDSNDKTRLYDISGGIDEVRTERNENPVIHEELDQRLDDWMTSFESADTSGTVDIAEAPKERLEQLGYLQ